MCVHVINVPPLVILAIYLTYKETIAKIEYWRSEGACWFYCERSLFYSMEKHFGKAVNYWNGNILSKGVVEWYNKKSICKTSEMVIHLTFLVLTLPSKEQRSLNLLSNWASFLLFASVCHRKSTVRCVLATTPQPKSTSLRISPRTRPDTSM